MEKEIYLTVSMVIKDKEDVHGITASELIIVDEMLITEVEDDNGN